MELQQTSGCPHCEAYLFEMPPDEKDDDDDDADDDETQMGPPLIS